MRYLRLSKNFNLEKLVAFIIIIIIIIIISTSSSSIRVVDCYSMHIFGRDLVLNFSYVYLSWVDHVFAVPFTLQS